MSVLELVDTHVTPLATNAASQAKPAAPEFADAEKLVDHIIEVVGKEIVLGAPLAIGKPVSFVNALYQRAKADPSITLRIETGITLEKPVGKSKLEKNFLEPFVEREFADVPDIDYIMDLRKGEVPPNITISEFFFKAGSFLNSPQQQNYTSTNYTHAVRDLLDKGVNVVGQLVAKRTIDGVTTYSLCSNSDLALDFAPVLKEMQDSGKPVAMIAEVNSNMPFMQNHAEVADNVFDFVLDQNLKPDNKDYALFAAPHASISPEDHMIGFYASTLLKDGGTLQVGIGSLSSALIYSTLLRHQNNAVYNQIVDELNIAEKFPITRSVGDRGIFEEGLYGCSELMVDGFMNLYKAGILKREVFEDLTVQTLLNNKKITTDVSVSTLLTLLEHDAIHQQLTAKDVSYLKRIGVFRESVEFFNGQLQAQHQTMQANLGDAEALQWITKFCLGDKLSGGAVMHGAFFIGPKDFYEALNNLSDEDHKKFCMTSVNYVNDLYDHFIGSQQLKQAQRKHARFINSAMMVTLNGSAISDALENGQVVSGVGGQYNFVAQSHQLPDSRSIMKLRSCSVRNGKLKSNIMFNYGHTTIPRQLRDIVITEYGIADLRGKPDHVVYTELIKIADSRFQQQLLDQAKAAGKVAKDYTIPVEFGNNTPESIQGIYQKYTQQNIFGPFPFGCSFTAEELQLGKALKALKAKTATPKGKIKCILNAITTPKPDKTIQPLLKRIGLENPTSIQDKLTQRLLIAELRGR
ncbi:acetyl-CoA hydrolase/transferase C-terminal domain-containing protein [Photobacterium alginatilyticum]|uniref:Acetyl-CoA hydrolase n=1 Tax=Photobacterium alginatilyticum TaxID=1775171 RepID=A0ABW9YDE1_9GAMM|nr:acetyl-CoA hydrolase/transferase C-terminal domain-containing protein [Photobacterium alginatilyticum]NBI51273.1 acetyl-CoA hydrolase [Photobacterium alginatilyticum]